jgi:hypothetical protein
MSTAEDEVQHIEDMIAIHLGVFTALESHVGEDGLTAAHRPLVPLYQRWLETARRIKAAVAQLRAKGQNVAGLDDLMRTINRSKLVAERFDDMVALNERMARGEPGEYIPLAEVLDELRSKP